MLRTYRIKYLNESKVRSETCIEASSKYDAKKRFYHENPNCEIEKVEESCCENWPN